MTITLFNSFLGKAPNWYKWCIIGFLILNPILFFVLPALGVNAGFILGWIVLLQFIFTLIFSIQCYPLQPGGLIALQVLFLGLTTSYHVFYEINSYLEVILFLVFTKNVNAQDTTEKLKNLWDSKKAPWKIWK